MINPQTQRISPITHTDPQDTARYQNFIQSVCEWEGVWGLYHNSWLLHRGESTALYCPLFTTREAAQSWGASIRTDHVPCAITLVELMENLMMEWRANGVVAGIAPTPSQKPVIVDLGQFERDLLSGVKAAMTARFGRK